MKWLQIVALQKFSRRKCDCFFALLSCQSICYLEFPANLTPISIMEEITKAIQYVNAVDGPLNALSSGNISSIMKKLLTKRCES